MDNSENLRKYLQDLPKIINQPRFISGGENFDPLYEFDEYSLPPIACYTCGKTVSKDHDLIVNSILHGFRIQYILDALGYTKYCCRRTIFTSAITSKIIDYYENLYDQYVNMASNE